MTHYLTKQEAHLRRAYSQIAKGVMNQALAEGRMPPVFGGSWSIKKKIFVSYSEALQEALEQVRELNFISTARCQKQYNTGLTAIEKLRGITLDESITKLNL